MSKELFVSSTPHETKVAIVEEDQLTEIYFERENEYTLAGSIYKGRVTRVLPGMQSAFVEIGLERDAFLYVTDFFEPQDDESDETFDTIPDEGGRSRRHHERATPVLEAPREINRESLEGESSSVSQAGPRSAQEETAARGEQEDKEPYEPARELTAERESSAGESSFRDEAARRESSREPSSREATEGAENDRGGRNSEGRRFGRRRRGRRGRGFPESKFDSRNAPRQPQRGNEEKSFGPPPGYQPIILPGESISKYRHMAETQAAQPAEQAERETSLAGGDAPAAHRDAEPAITESHDTHEHNDRAHGDWGTPAPETSSYVRGNYGTSDYRARGYQPAYEEAHEVSDPESSDREPGAGEAEAYEEAAAGRQRSSEYESEPKREEPRRRETEEIDVAAILAKHQEDENAGWGRSHKQSSPAGESRFGSMPGLVEEEEIEEEEMDQPSLLHRFEDDEYEDFEEEMLETAEAHDSTPSHRVGERPANAESAEPAEGGAREAEEQNGEGAEGISASEDAEAQIAEEEELEEVEEFQETSASGESAARAETRGPSGYQQKVAFDRRGRRRGGRRVRTGGGHGKRFHRAPLPQISDLLKEGQEILVQIAKEPIGKKGARITSHIALPGRFLVYMPTVNHNGVSRKIASEEERHRLKRIILSERQAAESHHGGFIVRTAAAHATEEDLRADIRFLLNLWSEIRSRSDSGKSPALIYHDLNLVERILRDQLSEGFSHIWVDSEQEYERIVRFVSRFQPQMVKRVKLYSKETPLFEQFSIQEEINKALKSKVWLKSGGYIVINQTEALVAIDVNTGKFVGKTQKLEDTIVKTNVDAIREIVRQVRLRDLGGIIVIDFIDMDERRNRQKVMQALEEALKSDRAPSKVLQFNDFGLVAITRKRVKQSLERTLGQPCTYCTGTGLIKSVATVCNEIYVEMRKMSRHLEGKDVFVRVNPEVGKALKANNARWLQDMEELTGKTVIVKPDPTLHQEQFDIH
jgi:ribonuclease G